MIALIPLQRTTYKGSNVPALVHHRVRAWQRPALCGLVVGLLALPTWAFEAAKVADGLYYNGTNSFAQLWTPLFLAQQGKLLDPFVIAKGKGVQGLMGRGKTQVLNAVTPFLYGGCETQVLLSTVRPLVADVPTVAVSNFLGNDCQRQQDNAMSFYRVARDRRGDNPFPTFFLDQGVRGVGLRWLYGVPGKLVGKDVPVIGLSEADIGDRPAPVNGVVSRLHFVPLPVIEPDLLEMALADKKPLPKYPVSVLEAAHRGNDVVVTPELLRQAQATIQERLWAKYHPRLEKAIGNKFGGIAKSYFELGLIQGVDLDNRRSFDYVGVARIGAITRAGPWRWVDVVYCWRKKDDSLSVIATSEDALYQPEHGFFSETVPSTWAPTLVVSGFSDFDKDKQLEVIVSLLRPYGTAAQTIGDTRSEPITLRQSTLYVWNSTSTSALAWQEAFRTAMHEESFVEFDPKNVIITRFGQ